MCYKPSWLISTIASYFLIVYLLLIHQTRVINLWIDALIIIVLLFIAIKTCPFLSELHSHVEEKPKKKK